MTTGYIVSSGLNPYQSHVIIGIFPNPLLSGIIPVVGYPPLWPLLLGLIYRLTFNITPDIFLYNFSTKIPVILSNIGLAYVVKKYMKKLEIPQKTIQRSWVFLLFNPFILLTTAAWGQFDSFIALLCITSIYFLSKGKIEVCALTLALSIALKPIALPLIGLPILFSADKIRKKNLRFISVFVVALIIFALLPFLIMNWSLPLGTNEVTSHLRMAGGLTPFNLVELFTDTRILPDSITFLGYIWIPALLYGYYIVYRNRPTSMKELAEKAIGLMLIFFLTRSWLSEPNINLLLPLMLIVSAGLISRRNLHLVWIIPLVFMILNMAVTQLFFLVDPSILHTMAVFDAQFGTARYVARFVVTVFWYILAIKILFRIMRGKNSFKN
jgi:hypothetical protein